MGKKLAEQLFDETAIKSRYVRLNRIKRIGSVSVDSGQVAVVDPCHVDPELGRQHYAAAKTTCGDGTYPVATVMIDGIEFLLVPMAHPAMKAAFEQAFTPKAKRSARRKAIMNQ